MSATAWIACACSSSKTVADPAKRGEAALINVQLGIDYFQQGNLQQAKEKIDRAIEQDPHSAQAQAAGGLLYDRLGEYEKAEHFFERAVAIEPNNPDFRNNFAVFLCRHNKFAKGEKQALAAASDPLYKTPEAAYLNAGYCARAEGDEKKAEKYFRVALSRQPRFAQALYEMADVEFKAQNFLGARAFIDRYMAAQKPAGPAALWLAIRVERALGNRATAGDYGRRLTNDYPSSVEAKEFLETTRGLR